MVVFIAIHRITLSKREKMPISSMTHPANEPEYLSPSPRVKDKVSLSRALWNIGMSSKSRMRLPGSENVPDGKAFTIAPSECHICSICCFFFHFLLSDLVIYFYSSSSHPLTYYLYFLLQFHWFSRGLQYASLISPPLFLCIDSRFSLISYSFCLKFSFNTS